MLNSRAERLGEALGAFELRRLLARPERLDAGAREIVDDAGRQRRLRADHDEIDRIALAEIDHRRMVGDIERHAFGLARDPGIARRAPQLGQQRGSGDLPCESVFAAAGTEQEDVHGKCSQMEGCRLLREGLARHGPAATTRLFLCGYVS